MDLYVVLAVTLKIYPCFDKDLSRERLGIVIYYVPPSQHMCFTETKNRRISSLYSVNTASHRLGTMIMPFSSILLAISTTIFPVGGAFGGPITEVPGQKIE